MLPVFAEIIEANLLRTRSHSLPQPPVAVKTRGVKPRNLPQKCACGKDTSIAHALDCKLGGYVTMRHDQMRNTMARLMTKAGCKSVEIEQQLLPNVFSTCTFLREIFRLPSISQGQCIAELAFVEDSVFFLERK